MARPRERIGLEDGLRLDLNSLLRHRIARSGPVICASISWGPRYSCEPTASGSLITCLSGASRGWLRLDLGSAEQSIDLVAKPRHFGGQQWYFVCPRLGRRASVLWMPPGANFFASRQAWGDKVAYGSQFRAWQFRALSRAQNLRYQLGGEEFLCLDEPSPPKPKGMHRRTYEAQLKRLESYEMKCDLYLASRV